MSTTPSPASPRTWPRPRCSCHSCCWGSPGCWCCCSDRLMSPRCNMLESGRPLLVALLLAMTTVAGAQSVAPLPGDEAGVTAPAPAPAPGQIIEGALQGEQPLPPPRREDPTWSATL